MQHQYLTRFSHRQVSPRWRVRRSIVGMTLAVIMLATLHTLLMLAQASGAVQRSDD